MNRVLLVPDSHKWCFGYMAQGIKKYAPADYDVDIKDSQEFDALKTYSPEWWKEYDAVCQFSWYEADYRVPEKVKNCVVVAHEGVMHSYPPRSQRDGSYLPLLATRARNNEHASKHMYRAGKVICFTETLAEECRQYNKNVVAIRPGVDTGIFSPVKHPKRRPFTIGWCGQPSISKGVELRNAVQAILPDDIAWNINERDSNDALTPDEMRLWYNECDLFLCTACSEGGPLTVLEAMACGRLVVSTPVGVVPLAECDHIRISLPCTRSQDVVVAAGDIGMHIMSLKAKSLDEIHLIKRYTRTMCESRFSWEKYSKVWLEEICK